MIHFECTNPCTFIIFFIFLVSQIVLGRDVITDHWTSFILYMLFLNIYWRTESLYLFLFKLLCNFSLFLIFHAHIEDMYNGGVKPSQIFVYSQLIFTNIPRWILGALSLPHNSSPAVKVHIVSTVGLSYIECYLTYLCDCYYSYLILSSSAVKCLALGSSPLSSRLLGQISTTWLQRSHHFHIASRRFEALSCTRVWLVIWHSCFQTEVPESLA